MSLTHYKSPILNPISLYIIACESYLLEVELYKKATSKYSNYPTVRQTPMSTDRTIRRYNFRECQILNEPEKGHKTCQRTKHDSWANDMVSISSTFNTQILQSWNVSRESFLKHFCTKNGRVKCWWNRTLDSYIARVIKHKQPNFILKVKL